MNLQSGSICAGMAGFDLAFSRAGCQTKWHSEIDPNCLKLLTSKLPHATSHQDLSAFKPDPRADSVDIVFVGTPCQDLSVAGQRAGLDGKRSGLFYQMVRVCKRLRPRLILWENVPGALSSNGGNDFACILRAFTGLKVEVPVDGWGNAGFLKTPYAACRWHVAWRVLDAQYFGVAQRRRRVFLVGSLGDASCLEILFETESVRGDSAPSREAGQRTAPTVEGRAGRSGETNFATSGGLALEGEGAVGSLTTSNAADRGDSHHNSHLVPVCSNRIGAHHGRNDLDNDTYVMAHGQGNAEIRSDGEPSLTCNHEAPIVARCISGERDGYNDGSDQTYIPVVTPLQEVNGRQSKNQNGIGIGIGNGADPMYTLQSGQQHGVAIGHEAIAFKPNQGAKARSSGASVGLCPTLESAEAGNNKPAIAFQTRIARNGRGQPKDITDALTSCDGGTHADSKPHVATATMVRRLTPTECLRLQGFPDDYFDGLGFSDSSKYKMTGNSVAVPCVEWIARRMVKILDAQGKEA